MKRVVLIRNRARWATHNMAHISRMYPRGSRLNSSNYNPAALWDAGVQMTALNYQTFDTGMHLNNAMFAANGGCGYVLKPPYLRQERDAEAGFPLHELRELSLPAVGLCWQVSSSAAPPEGALPLECLGLSEALAQGRRVFTVEELAGWELAEHERAALADRFVLDADGTCYVPVPPALFRLRVELIAAVYVPTPQDPFLETNLEDLQSLENTYQYWKANQNAFNDEERSGRRVWDATVIDPFVSVEVHGGLFSGAGPSAAEVSHKSTWESSIKAQNGLNPTWEGAEGRFEIIASHEHLTQAVFTINYKRGIASRQLAVASINLACCRSGLRCVTMREAKHGLPLRFCKLLLRVAKDPCPLSEITHLHGDATTNRLSQVCGRAEPSAGAGANTAEPSAAAACPSTPANDNGAASPSAVRRMAISVIAAVNPFTAKQGLAERGSVRPSIASASRGPSVETRRGLFPLFRGSVESRQRASQVAQVTACSANDSERAGVARATSARESSEHGEPSVQPAAEQSGVAAEELGVAAESVGPSLIEVITEEDHKVVASPAMPSSAKPAPASQPPPSIEGPPESEALELIQNDAAITPVRISSTHASL